jgi:hypothetical protein
MPYLVAQLFAFVSMRTQMALSNDLRVKSFRDPVGYVQRVGCNSILFFFPTQGGKLEAND